MSEHYDFHYQPTGSGAISGQQVLEQTEDAINELGDYVNDNVGGAMDVAQQALETAQNAEQDAQTALDTANSFSSAIQSAQQNASTALSTAQTAQTTASNANNTAIQAQQDASSAVTTANNASGQVNTLSGTVTALGQRVTTAEGNISQNTNDITALTTRVGTAEGNITTLQNDVSIAQGNASSAMATAGQVKQQAFVFRYSSTALTASSTNSNALLDNTDNLKVGDKVIDSSGVLFSITAIDTQNSTFTIGTALIDLAQDSDVVHKSGNETIAGVKTFSDDITLQGTTTPVIKTISNIVQDTSAYNGSVSWVIRDKDNLNNILESSLYKYSAKSIDWQLKLTGIDNGVSNSKGIRFTLDPVNNVANFLPIGNNNTSLGNSSTKWKDVYATNYYYGSNNVEFSTKFVTTDTAQTISGQKLFNDINTISSSAEIGVSGGNNSFKVLDKNNKILARLDGGTFSTGMAYSQWLVNNGTDVFNGVFLYQPSANLVQLRPYSSTSNVQLGASNRYFTDCYTSKVNALEPSSLSLPSDRSARIDISSYFTNTGTGDTNNYSVPANGYINLQLTDVVAVHCFSSTSNNLTNYCQTFSRASDGMVYVLFPVRNGDVFKSTWYTSTTVNVGGAYFIPCQGNV